MNPLGERAPDTPVPGGCGDPLCARRAWFRWESPHDPGVTPPCDRCSDALVDLMAVRQRDHLRSRDSADCHVTGPW